MANFVLNFSAYTSGVHKIAWRTFETPVGEYNYINVNVNAPSYPVVQSVTIPVNGSLYCADDGNGRTGIEFTGWILPMCYGEEYNNDPMIPDHATVFTHKVEKVESNCHRYTISLHGLPARIGVIDGGTGYTEPPEITVTRDASDTNTHDCRPVAHISGGSIDYIIFTDDDHGAYDPSNPPTVSVQGNASLSIAIDNNIKVNMNKYACDGYYGDTSLYLEKFDTIGQSVELCANTSEIQTIDPCLVPVDNGPCQCCDCSNVTIDTTNANSGMCIVWYNTCWDESGSITLYGMEIQYGQTVQLQNVINDSLCVATNTLENTGTPVNPIITH